jgi:Uma2 family endonuclease
MHWTEADYLAFENASATKHEYLDGEIFALAGSQPLHNRIASNTLIALGTLARGRRCGTFNSDQRIYVPSTGLYTYADGAIVCSPWEIHSDGMCLLNPMLLFEVLSPSTRDYDGGAKREHYQQIPSLRHLLLIDQPACVVRHHWRSPGGEWETRESDGVGIPLAEFEGMLALADVYLLEE